MANYDLFNGDADGLCSLQQLRLHEPLDAELVTGLKRDIGLMATIDPETGDRITVLDVSMEKNVDALHSALQRGASVFYADHHIPGDILVHENLTALIDTSAETCTSLIINDYLKGAESAWAVVGAYGDNFDNSAKALGEQIGLRESELFTLRQLGICLNYNGYGFTLGDLLFHPADLFRLLHPYRNPLEFALQEPGYARLLAQYQDDKQRSGSAVAEIEDDHGAVFLLPDESWARRIVGVMGNDLAQRYPDRAHALLVDMGDDHWRVSVRAPYTTKQGADELCRQFNSGGGRKAAAGINALPSTELPNFIDRFNQQYQ